MQQPTGIYQESQKLIGEGSNGNVYQISKGQEKYVEKRIPISQNGSAKKVERQIGILKKINHPNIVKYLGFESTNQQYKIRMQLCNGQNLRDFLLSNQYKKQILNNNPIQFATKICLSIINTYCFIKRSMVSHRDLKLENIMIEKNKDGQYVIKFIDFGESKFIIKEALTVVGTYGRMAPEIYYSQPYTEACDCYSLGITLFQVFEGIRKDIQNQNSLCSPYGGFRPSSDNQIKIYYEQKVFEGIILTKGRTPELFRNIIRGLLNPNPKNRMKLQTVVQTLIKGFSGLEEYMKNLEEEKQKLISSLDLCKRYQSIKQIIFKEILEIQELYNKLFVPINKYLQKKVNYKQLNQFMLLLSVISEINLRIHNISEKLKFSIQYTLSSVINQSLSSQQFEQISNRKNGIENALKMASIKFKVVRIQSLDIEVLKKIFLSQNYQGALELLRRYFN